MWAEVVEVARVEGVEATARAALGPRAAGGAVTVAGTAAGEMPTDAGGGFVELDAGRLGCHCER